jgi:hypothetical protein
MEEGTTPPLQGGWQSILKGDQGMKPVCALFVVALLSGCASIIQGKTQSITFTSVPGAATFSVKNRGGTVIHTGTTPSTLELARGSGYFKSEQYTVTLEKPGYASRMIELSGSVNGWYIGNVLLGGLIGMLIVDPITGAMYTLKPEVVEGTLQVEAVGLNGDERLLTVMLAEDLSVDLWRHAQRIPVDATNQ